MYRSIIVPLDGSARGNAALPVAAALAQASGATLDIVRVHINERPDLADDPSWDAMFREGEQRLLDSLALAYESLAGKQVGTALLDGPVVQALADFAASRVAPLFVIAARGRTGLRRALLGSTSDGLVRQSETPVLVLRVNAEDGPQTWTQLTHPFHRVSVPLDGTAHAEAGLAHAMAVARATGAKLHLVRVIGPVVSSAIAGAFALHPQPYEEASVERNDLAHEYLQGVVQRIHATAPKIEVTTEVSLSSDAATAIIESCRRKAIDLVVMATHGRGMSRVLFSAVGDRVLRDGPDAILFVRPPKGSVPSGLRTSSRNRNTAPEPPAPLTVR